MTVLQSKVSEGVDEQAVFGRVHSRFQRFERVARVDRYDFLRQHRPGVDTFIGNEVHHDSGVFDLAAPIRAKGALDGMRAGERFR